MSTNNSSVNHDLVSRALDRKNGKTSGSTVSDGGDLISRALKRKTQAESLRQGTNAQKAGSEILSRINTWLNNSKTYINNYNRRTSGFGENTFDASSQEWLDTLTTQKSNFDLEADNIRSILNTYGKYYDSEWVREINKALDERGKTHNEIIKAATARNDYFSQWDSEEAYKDALAAAANIEELRAVDLDRLQKEISRMENQLTSINNGIEYHYQAGSTGEGYKERKALEEQLNTLSKNLSEKKKYYNNVKRMQEYYALTEEAMSAWDVDAIVERYYAERKQRESSSPWDVAGAQLFSPLDLVIDNKYLEDAEKRTLIYMFEKGGADSMWEYYDKLEPYLAQREAAAIAKSKDKWWEKALFTVEVGLDQFADGIDTIFGGDHEYDVTQMASAMVREELGDVGRFFYDAATSTVNMVPSMLTSYAIGLFNPAAGAAAGATLMGASSAGNGYTQMKQLGYSDGQATAYGLMVGVSETTLQYALGGISKLGGKASNHFISKMVARVDGVLGKAAIKLGGNMLSEGAEEALQTVLEPLFQSIVTGKEYTVPELEEIIYSGLLGAFTSFGFEAGPTVVNTVKEIRSNTAAGREMLSDKSGAEALMKLAYDKAYDEAGVVKTADKLKAKLDASKDTGKISGKTARLATKLSRRVDSARFSQNNTDVKNALIERGVDKKKADETASAILKTMEGKELLPHEVKLLDSQTAQNVISELKTDAESSVNLRNAEYALGRLGVSMNEDGSVVLPEGVSETDTSSAQKEKSAFNAKTSRTVNVSEDGVTRMTETGEAVKIADVASVDKNGDVYLKLENGQTVNMRDVSFSNDNEAALYEQIASFGLHPTVMKTVIDGYDASFGISPAEYLKAASIAYTFGKYNIPKRELSEALPEAVNDHIYKLGQVFTENKIKQNEERIKAAQYEDAEINEELLNLTDRIANGESVKDNEKVFLGTVSDAVAEKIYKLTGVDAQGFNIAVEARQIEHILKRHGENGVQDNSLKDHSDIARLEHALRDPDNISYAGKTQAYSYSKNGRNKTADTVLCEKDIGGKSYYVVEAVPDTKAKTLYVVTAFIGKTGYKKEASQLIDTKGPNVNVHNGSASASDNIVAQPKNVVNSNDMQNTAKNAGKLVFEKGVKAHHENQQYALRVLNLLAKRLGLTIHVYKSDVVYGERVYKRADGTLISGKNGWYDTKTSEIWLDINAGATGQGLILFTASHELVHFIRQWSETKFKVLADFLVEKYGEAGQSVDDLIRKQLSDRGIEYDKAYDEAYEEVIASSMEAMLKDGKVLEKLAELEKKDHGIAQKIRTFLKKFAAKLKAAYKGIDPATEEGRFFAEMTEEADRITGLFAEALHDAGENLKKTDVSKLETSGGVKYSTIGRNALIADELKPEWWWVGNDNKDRYDISDKDMKVDLTGYVEDPKYVGDYVKHDQLFRAYPEIKDYRVEIRDLIDGLAYRHGAVNHDAQIIYIKRGLDKESAKEAFLHEFQHIIQRTEKFVGGTNKDSAGRALFNKVYNDIKNDAEFKALKTAESKREFVVHEIERRFSEYLDANGLELKPGFERNFETAAMFAYWNYYGEIEARNTADKERSEMTEEQLAQNRAENNGNIYDKEIEDSKFIDNLIEIGYTESEAKKIIRFGVDSYDNQLRNGAKSDTQRGASHADKRATGRMADAQTDGNRRADSGRGVHGERGVRGADTGTVGVGARPFDGRLNTEYNHEKYSSASTDVSTRGLLVNALESATENDAEREKLAEYKSKIAEIEVLENKLEDINRQIREISFGKGPRDKEKLRSLMDEKTKTANRIDIADRQLLRLEAAKVLQNIVERQRKAAHSETNKNRNTDPYKEKNLHVDAEIYSYNFMTALDPMRVETMPPLSSVKENDKISQEKAVSLGLENANRIGKQIASNQYVVKNAYTGREIVIGKNGLNHSLDASNIHRLRTNARLSAIGGYIVQNAVPINGLVKKNPQADGTYAMACLVNDGSGYVVAIVTVDEFNSRALSIDFSEVTHSINGRFLAKKEDSRSSTRELDLGQASASTTAISEISIADFLEIVNSTHRSLLSDDVLRHFNEARPENGYYSDKVLFSDRGGEDVSTRGLLVNALESAAESDAETAYTYKNLIKKKDVCVPWLDSVEESDIRRYKADKNMFAKNMRALAARQNNAKNSETSVFLHCDDLNADIQITRDSFKHGAARMDSAYIAICSSLSDVLKNSIVVNELRSREGTSGSYVLLSLTETSDSYVIVRSIVNKKTWKLEDYNELYAVRKKSIKKEDVGFKPPHYIQKNGYGTSSTISVSDFLEFVNSEKLGSGVLSDDVIEKLGHERKLDAILTSELKYSDRGGEDVSTRGLLVNALESAAGNDAEREKLAQYKAKISDIIAIENQLEDINRQIREIAFSRGPRDMDKLRALQEEKKAAVDRLNREDGRLLKLENAQPLKDLVNRERDKAYKRAKERANEQRERAEDKRKRTLRRNQIRRVVDDLNRLLTRPTKEKHVPIGLQKPVADFLSAIEKNDEPKLRYYDSKIEKLEREIEELKHNPYASHEELIKKETELSNAKGRWLKTSEHLSSILNVYRSLNSENANVDPEIAVIYRPEVEAKLREIIEDIGRDVPLSEMTLSELDKVYTAVRLVERAVRNGNKLFSSNSKQTISEYATSIASEIMNGDESEIGAKWKIGNIRIAIDELTPLTLAKAIGSETFAKLLKGMFGSSYIWAVDMDEAKLFHERLTKGKEAEKWNFDEKKDFTFSGETISLSLSELMSLYALSKRSQAVNHLTNGGFYLFSEKGKRARAYKISKEELSSVGKILSKSQREFADKMQEYLSTNMGNKGNEAARIMYGVDLFLDDNYFPMKVKNSHLPNSKQDTADAKTRTVNLGMTKQTAPGASGALVISDFYSTWYQHVNDMSLYHGVTSVEDFTRVWKSKTTLGDGSVIAICDLVEARCGKAVADYINQLINDANAGIRGRDYSSTEFLDKMVSRTKRAAVFASLSVAAQQFSAIERAKAYIPERYFVKSVFSWLLKEHKSSWAEMKKYCPVALLKEMGGYDLTGGSTMDWVLGRKSRLEKLEDGIGKLPALIDEYAWCAIWEAGKQMTASLRGKNGEVLYEKGSKEFFEKASEIVTEAINHTQVYDSIFVRSGHMRSNNLFAKNVTMFMTEPTTSVNMLVEASIDLKRGGEITTAGGTVNARRFALRKIRGVASASIGAALAAALIHAMRDDDEEKTFIEKYVGHATENIADNLNLLNMLPIGRDIVSLSKGYNVERADMTLIADMIYAVNGLDSDKPMGEKIVDLTTAISNFTSIPLKNLIKDAVGLCNTLFNSVPLSQTTWLGIKESAYENMPQKLLGIIPNPIYNDLSDSDLLYEAMLGGSKKEIGRIKARYDSESQLQSAIRKGLRENDPRIREAAKLNIKGDMKGYAEIVNEIASEKIFEKDRIIEAVNLEINAINRESKVTDNEPIDEDETVTSLFNASMLNRTLDSGDTETALEMIGDMVNAKVKSGKTEQEAKSSIKSNVTRYWKEKYIAAWRAGDDEEMLRIRKLLTETKLYGSSYKVSTTVSGWLKDAVK